MSRRSMTNLTTGQYTLGTVGNANSSGILAGHLEQAEVLIESIEIDCMYMNIMIIIDRPYFMSHIDYYICFQGFSKS